MPDDQDQIEYSEEDGAQELMNKINKLKEKLETCQKEKQEYLAGWQRAQADFVNYRRRQEEQVGEWLKMAGENVIRDILPVLDALDASEKQAGENYASLQRSPLKEEEKDSNPPTPLSKGGENEFASLEKGGEGGLGILRKQLMKILSAHGLEEIKSIGEKFNPEFHEAVEWVDSDGEEEIIVEEVLRGYKLNNKVIRSAKVKVTKNK